MIKPMQPEPGIKQDLTGRISKINIDYIAFRYQEDSDWILNNIQMVMEQGEKVALVGTSGCGKSTLAKLLYQHYDNYQGTISVNGIDLKRISRKSLYKNVGYISQKNFVFHETIRNNVCLYETFSEERLAYAVEKAGIKELIDSMPEGLDTVITENGMNLSGGQIQRIAIARLIIREYSVIIADEVTANLDIATGEEIMKNLLDLDAMVIVITHHIYGAYMQGFDRIYDLSKDTVKAQNNKIHLPIKD